MKDYLKKRIMGTGKLIRWKKQCIMGTGKLIRWKKQSSHKWLEKHLWDEYVMKAHKRP